MTSLDPRMLETLPAPSAPSIHRANLTSKVVATSKREDRAIDQLALAFAMDALRHIQDMPPADVAEALYVNARALERAAEVIDERARLISKGGKNGKGRS